ncbi:MAG: hypothetical protein NTW67_00550 [Candidatus Woesearchaeota archaeon]|nr:hypothetical protein [Candidatus Woesearchaeota archaeon]
MASTRIPSMFQSLATHLANCETATWYGVIAELSDIAASQAVSKGLEKIAGKQRMYRSDGTLVAVAGDLSRDERNAMTAYLNSLNTVKKYHIVMGSYYDFLGSQWQHELIGRNGEQR